jgi:peptidoglycan DL-endopeptidase CwlO
VAGSIKAYTTQVDRVLGAGQGLFGSASGGRVADDGDRPSVTPPPDTATDKGLAGDVNDAAERYRRGCAGLRQLDAHTDGIADVGRDEARRGHAGATAAMETAHDQAAAITPTSTTSPSGVRLLVSRMDERLAAMQNQIADTQASNRVLALRLRQVATEYRRAAVPSESDRKPMHGG